MLQFRLRKSHFHFMLSKYRNVPVLLKLCGNFKKAIYYNYLRLNENNQLKFYMLHENNINNEIEESRNFKLYILDNAVQTVACSFASAGLFH